MAIQKKHGKGRLDKWYKLAKEKGYRARAAFKLIQLNKKYAFLEKSRVLLDLCAAPGSWCQVAAESMPVNSVIVGVDICPIKPIPRVITLQSDITTDKCRATIRQHLKSWKADTVLHDGAPNVGTAWVQDSFNQAELTLQAMKLAIEFLVEGGTFVTKLFRSKDYNSLLWVFSQLFTKVEATKPPSSRNVSAEIFVICQGFKAPKRIDPKFVDPRSVFAELPDPTPNNEAKVFKPEVKKRKRDGYEEGNYIQFKEAPASDFIQTTDPISMLGSLNRLRFTQSSYRDVALEALDKLPETTNEIRDCCKDLRVLGKKEFRNLLRWRLKVREKFGLVSSSSAGVIGDEIAEIEQMDEELQIQGELQTLNEKEASRRKRERRRQNEKKQKDNIRMQLNMIAPSEIGLEQTVHKGTDSMFSLKTYSSLNHNETLGASMILEKDEAMRIDHDNTSITSAESSEESDFEMDRLDRCLDSIYKKYQERRLDTDSKCKDVVAKEHQDTIWEGFSVDEAKECSEGSDIPSDDETPLQQSVLDPTKERPKELSKWATQFFNQDIFKAVDLVPMNKPNLLESSNERDDVSLHKLNILSHTSSSNPGSAPANLSVDATTNSNGSNNNFETLNCDDLGAQSENHEEKRDNKRLNIDIITAEAMTLAQKFALGRNARHDIIDDGFNKHAFKDCDGLPDWFLDDERRHDKPHRPITAAGAAAIKEKLRALNARPIKKVREAKERKKFKAAQRLEKLRKKSALLNDDEGMSEREKAQSIAKLMSKASKKKPAQRIKVVVARGFNKGVSGRPRGVKGKYKIVDARLKKDVRAMKRLAKSR